MDRREFMAAAAIAVGSPVVATETIVGQPAVDPLQPYLRTVWVWHSENKEWVRCRLLDVRKGQIFSVWDREDGFAGGSEHLVADGNATRRPPLAFAMIECHPLENPP